MAKLRLSLTIPGAVSLGAYEGGALAALVVAARTLGEETILIDTIASASAGSITGLLTARALLRGCDPVALLTKAWVENVSFDTLKSKDTQSPLSAEALDAMANQVLGQGGVPEGAQSTWQSEPITLSMAVNTLAGFTYEIANLTRDTSVSASTFLDFYTVKLDNTDDASVYLTHAQGAIASGSNAMGFPPKLLNRKADQAEYGRGRSGRFPRGRADLVHRRRHGRQRAPGADHRHRRRGHQRRRPPLPPHPHGPGRTHVPDGHGVEWRLADTAVAAHRHPRPEHGPQPNHLQRPADA